VDASISVANIEDAAGVIDPVFVHSPQFFSEPLSARLRVRTALKVETINPIRSFKGRGATYLLHRLAAELDDRPIVCATAGNFGQAMAYACRERSRRITVFAPHTANPLKLERMKALGVKLELEVGDFDQAKDAARRHADATGDLFIEDGLLGPIAEGAATMARELTEELGELDAIFVPLGNGSLVNGVGTWLKHRAPNTRVIAVCAKTAPAMALSFEARRSISAPSSSIADGIAIRVPVPEAVDAMLQVVDEVMLVTDEEMLAGARALHTDVGLVVEPSGAAGVAAIARTAELFMGKRVATILTGGNLTEQQIKTWLY
jgi:threonine dehydratase